MAYTSLATVWKYTKGQRHRLFIVMALFALATLPLPLVPLYLGRLTEAIAAPERDAHNIITQAVIMCGLGIVHSLAWHGSEMLSKRWIIPIQGNYETRVFADVIHNDYPYFVEKSTGKISASIGIYADKLRSLTERLFWGYIPELVVLVGLVGVLASLNWQSALIFVAGVCLLLISIPALKRSIAAEAAHTDSRSTKTAALIDSITNFVSVKSFGTTDREILDVDAKQQDVIKAHKKAFFWSVMFWFTASFVVRWITWPAIVAVNVWLYLGGQSSVAEVTSAIAAGFLFTTTIWELVWYASEFTQTMAALEETHTYLFGKKSKQLRAIPAQVTTQPYPETAGLHFDNVTFAYPDKPERDVLHNIDLHVKAGEKVGIVGHSGSGKTTLVKLLLGYYPPTTGALTTAIATGPAVADRYVSDVLTKDVCTYVPQDTAMFNRTVADNIAYARGDDVTRSDVHDAAKLAYADEFIQDLPEGYDTLVGERGVKLSGGQRQRIAIARALLNPKPVLVLDEATSALDTDSEVHVQNALENLWEKRTVIAIAHRLSTLRSMDRIVVMDGGAIIEQGSHTELMAADGTYAHLWTQQSGGFLAAT